MYFVGFVIFLQLCARDPECLQFVLDHEPVSLSCQMTFDEYSPISLPVGLVAGLGFLKIPKYKELGEAVIKACDQAALMEFGGTQGTLLHILASDGTTSLKYNVLKLTSDSWSQEQQVEISRLLLEVPIFNLLTTNLSQGRS